MAKIWQISDGRSYVVNGDPGTTITYTNSTSNGTAAGKQAASIPAGATSVTFPSNGAEVEISSDTATIDQVFNAAAAGSGSSSGGSGSAGGVTFQVVDTLPSQGAAGVIYLVKVSETGDDKFEEWIWVDSAWESIGTTAVDPTTYAKLIGGNTFEGNQVINGDLTVTGDVSGVTESNYNVVETAETTITPTGGTWVRYTGSETTLTVTEPGWDGEAEISYLETATPVDLQGVTWSPAKPILTGNGPFVYTLVHAGDGQMLAGAYGYSVATAEAVQAVVSASATNAVVLGAGASTTGENSIVLGAGAQVGGLKTVAIGSGVTDVGNNSVSIGADTNAKYQSVSIGYGAKSDGSGTSVGRNATSTSEGFAGAVTAKATGWRSVAIGSFSKATAYSTVALGQNASAADIGVVVFRSEAQDAVNGYGTSTQLYFAGANTPLANTYEGGEAMMGYVVRDSAGNVMIDAEGNAMVGTQKLSVLFPNNRGENAFSPAVLDLDGEYTPKPMFRPSDLDLPVEEPTEPEDVTTTIPDTVIPEPEPYTPLPVYPIAEPENVEADIPEPEVEPYTPLPVYPIVEPEIPEEPTE